VVPNPSSGGARHIGAGLGGSAHQGRAWAGRRGRALRGRVHRGQAPHERAEGAASSASRSTCFESPSPSADPSALHLSVRSSLFAPDHLYAPCLLSCFGSPDLPTVYRFSYLFTLPLLISVHVICSEYSVSVCYFLYYIIGLSHTHMRSRLMPACAWVVIFFDHFGFFL
jgi:hypothetical protein